MEIKRLLSHEGKHPFEEFEWERENIQIPDKDGGIVYECSQAEFPKPWSWIARQTVASKYFRESRSKTEERETSVKTMVMRVANTIGKAGVKQKYFDEKTADVFVDELMMIFLGQYASLNSPAWFNVGVAGLDKPLGSACFINEVVDDMHSILELAVVEGLIFKEGAGSGVNFSKLRGSNEPIRGGGHASGPVSFLQGYDAFANVILSGGRTRRAARMCILDIDHPDIEKFINMKAEQEDIAAMLVLGGLSSDFRDTKGAYSVVKHQTGNNSVRVPDDFMRKVRELMYFQKDSDWPLTNRTDKEINKTVSVNSLFSQIAKAAHKCGDPGIQFQDTINQYNTCSVDGEIAASNPCFTGDMRLLTSKGYLPFKQLVNREDVVIVNEQGECTNGSVQYTGNKEVYQINFSRRAFRTPIKCTANHIIKLADETTKETQNLRRGDRLKPYIQIKTSFEREPFLAGFIQGDGQTGRLLSTAHLGIEVNFGAKDTEILQFAGWEITKNKSYITYSREAADIAQKYQLVPATLPNRPLPQLPKGTQLLDFLGGLYSANGSVIAKTRIALKTSCAELADQLLNILHTLKIQAYKTTNNAHPVKFSNGTYVCKESYDINIHHYESILRFAEKISFMQTHKREKLRQLLLSRAPSVESVKYLGTEKVYDFTEPKTHWGVVEGIVVHNCSEFVFLNNNACNLSSINLCKFMEDKHVFDTKTFKHVVRTLIIAQDILVDFCGYPTPKIEANSHKYRPIGLGFCNLGGLLMSWGLAYDSEESRTLAAAVTSLMTGQAYATSAELAAELKPFERFEDNKTSMEDVLSRHYKLTRKLPKDIANVSSKAVAVWQEVMGVGFGRRKGAEETGFRNAQVTLLAPTGTIAFMMDAATTGVEPDIALTKTKLMVGGSSMTYTNPNVTQGLKCLEYTEKQIEELANFLKKNGHFEGSILKEEHLPVFDCASPVGSRKISVDGHIDMVAAIQPFLSGAISKTFNMPHNATVKDVERTFLKAWESGVKCITVYREGSKLSEPLRVREIKEETLKKNVLQRRKLPADLLSFRHGFSVGGHKGFIHIGHDPETEDPVEIFIRVAHYGATAGGLLDSYGILFSKALQFGIPMEELIQHMIGSKFPPAGVTSNSKIPMAGSIMDYIAKYLKIKYLNDSPEIVEQPSIPPMSDDDFDLSEDMCPVCGAFLHRTGTCTQCPNCGHSTGICG